MKKTLLFLLFIVFGLLLSSSSNAVTQNQIDSTVQIVCPDDYGGWYSGSGTIIDPKGIILTNEHLVTDDYGGVIDTCFIGFVESIGEEPNFGTETNPNLADVKYYTTSNDMDAAILYLDNPTNKSYPYVNIWNSNSDNLQFGDKIEILGFPSIGGSTITYTSGDFSGFGSSSDETQNYIKTTALLEHGNSGGSSYNSIEQFIGIPTMAISGLLDSMNYILSVNSIKNWLSGILGSQYQQEIIEQKPIIEIPSVSIQDDITPPDISAARLVIYDCSKWYTWTNKFGNPQTNYNITPDMCNKIEYNKNKSYPYHPQKIMFGIILPDETYYDIAYYRVRWNDGQAMATIDFKYPEIYSYETSGSYKKNYLQFIHPFIMFREEGSYYLSIRTADEYRNISEGKMWKYEYKLSNDNTTENEPATTIDMGLTNRLKGKLLLQVEDRGRIWYVDFDGKRYEVTFTNALSLFENFALGISNSDLEKIPLHSDNWTSATGNRLKGKLLLQVEQSGRIWYVDFDGKRWEVTWANLMELFESLSLGITDDDLYKIGAGEL